MKQNKRLNIPVAILHAMGDVQYKISGNLIGINESSNTCTIRFRNGRVENGISMDDVYIAEGLLDTIKKYGKKFAGWIVKKVKGLVAFCTPDGKIDENSFCSPVNILAKQSNGTLPAACTFYPSQNIVDQAEAAGINVDVPDEDEQTQAEIDEIDGINRFWTRVQNVAGTTDKSVAESISYVTEAYYHNSLAFKKLNEAGTLTLKTAKDKLDRDDLDGKWVNTSELEAVIKRSIRSQLNLINKTQAAAFDNEEDDNDIDPRVAALANDIAQDDDQSHKKYPIPLIWGAPGIGKTTIINQVIKDLKNDNETPVNLYFYSVYCAGLDADSFRLPAPVEKNTNGDIKDAYFRQGVISWLPMYRPRSAKYNAMMEDRFSRCMHISDDGDTPLLDADGNEYQGGVLFLDEVVRVNPHAFPVIMNICDRGLQEMKLADSWAIICAANRYIDDPTQDASLLMEATPILQRFIHYTYIPERDEWLDWARSTNKYGVAHVDPQICDFIASMPEWVWYRTIDKGGYDAELKKAFNTTNAADFYKDGISYENIDAIKDAAEEANSPIGMTKEVWNGRTWERISNEYSNMLKTALLQNPKKYSYPICLSRSIVELHYNGIDNSILEEALDHVPENQWKRWCNDYHQKYVKGLSGFDRMSYIRAALIDLVKEHSGGNNPGTAREMKKYFDWQSIFKEPDIIESIYTKGLLPKKYAEKDDLGRSENGGFNWKDNTSIVREVEKFIMREYPGSAGADFAQYISYIKDRVQELAGEFDTLGAKKTSSVEKIVLSKIKSAFSDATAFNAKEFAEMFTVHTNTDKYGDLTILNYDKLSPVIKTILYNIIKNCSFVSNMLNLTKYYIKIDYSINTYAVIGNYAESNNYRDFIFKTYSFDQNAVNAYRDVVNSLSSINKQNIEKNPIIASVNYFNVFDLLKRCLTTAFKLKEKKINSGKINV